MEDYDIDKQRDDEEEEEDLLGDLEGALTFDDVVSFTMLTETAVTLVGIVVFFILTIFRIF